jgi:hypothetical protein
VAKTLKQLLDLACAGVHTAILGTRVLSHSVSSPNLFLGTASARTSDPGASHRMGLQLSDLKMFNRQPLDLKSAE